MRLVELVRPRRFRGPSAGNGFSFVELVFVLSVIAILSGIALAFWLGVYRQRVFNTVALTDVANVARAVDGLPDPNVFSMTVTGPGPIPGVPGAQLSGGTTLFLRRSKEGESFSFYLRGSHSAGSVTYYFQDGTMFADSEPL
jgi:prepilin-type N-terminal cleavage/methylation domain-containing protein